MSSLGNDLSRLRKEQDLTLEDIRDQTKIPLRVLRSIEDDTIFTDFNENKTYIRSFVRSYGKTLGIDDRILRIALDQTELDQYQDLLQKVDPYDPGEITSEPPFTIPDADDRKIRQRIRGVKDKTSAKHRAERRTGKDPNKIKDYSKQAAPAEDSINWADVGQRFRAMENGSRVWIGIILIVLALGAIGYFFIYQTNSRQLTSPAVDSLASIEQDMSDTDSLQLQLDDASTSSTEGMREELSDTLQLVVYAARGKLEPVRVRSDLYERTFPYWLEQGQAMRFNFVDSIRIRGQYNRMVLMMNGHPIQDFLPEFYEKNTQQLHISRNFFEQDPKWRSPSRDTLNLGVAPPDTIKERPTFNQE